FGSHIIQKNINQSDNLTFFVIFFVTLHLKRKDR
ncbi:MAG: hypothetical protein F083_3075, partial [bacterium F083]